jgi:allophanate hydrolase subunit 2
MDVVAFKIANILAGNDRPTDENKQEELDALEVVVPTVAPPASGGSRTKRGGPLALELLFHNEAVVGLAGALAEVTLDGQSVDVWSTIKVGKGAKLRIGGVVEDDHGNSGGLRVYVAVRGGFVSIPSYLGSKSTSIGFGGYQVSMHYPFANYKC